MATRGETVSGHVSRKSTCSLGTAGRGEAYKVGVGSLLELLLGVVTNAGICRRLSRGVPKKQKRGEGNIPAA